MTAGSRKAVGRETGYVIKTEKKHVMPNDAIQIIGHVMALETCGGEGKHFGGLGQIEPPDTGNVHGF